MATNKFAVVTGATSGIGRATAFALAQWGYDIGVVYNQSPPGDLLNEITHFGQKAVACRADLASTGEVIFLGNTLSRDQPHIDVLVHSAGVFRTGTVGAGSRRDFDEMYRVNLLAPYLLTQALLPNIIGCQGKIVFVNSSVALNPTQPGKAGYTSSKCGLRGLADSLRAEVNEHGVRVVSFYVGRTATPMQAEIAANTGAAFHPEKLLQPADVAASIVSAIHLPPTAEITDLSIRPMLK